ncbi:MAG: hypothetical protein WC619_01735 [Patescibacteria group bacterium]
MIFGELRPGDWFIYSVAVKDSEPILMEKLEFPVEPRNFSGASLGPLTAVSVFFGAFSSVPDDAEVIKVSRTFEELSTRDRFILVDDLGKPSGVVIYTKVLRDPGNPPSPENVFLALREDGTVKAPFPEGVKVIKIR